MKRPHQLGECVKKKKGPAGLMAGYRSTVWTDEGPIIRNLSVNTKSTICFMTQQFIVFGNSQSS